MTCARTETVLINGLLTVPSDRNVRTCECYLVIAYVHILTWVLLNFRRMGVGYYYGLDVEIQQFYPRYWESLRRWNEKVHCLPQYLPCCFRSTNIT